MYGNNKHASGRGRFKTKLYSDWILAASHMLNQQRVGTVRGKYYFGMVVERKDNRRRDIDNLIKGVKDLLVSQGVVDDDSRCEGLERVYWDQTGSIKGCRVELRHA